MRLHKLSPVTSRSRSAKNIPFDPGKWKAHVQALFPVMEDKGDYEIKMDTDTKPEKETPKTLPQVAKMKQYTKLKQQSSFEEPRREEIKLETKIKKEEMKTSEVSSKLAEKRRRFLLRKQTHSAPDEDESAHDEIASTSTDSRTRRTNNLCMGGRCRGRGSDSSIQPPPIIKLDQDVGIEHLDDLRYPDGCALCHFCKNRCDQSIHDEARLKIVSGGLIQTRDGSTSDSPSQYMNLPSPMFQCEEDSRVSFQQQFELTKQPIEPPDNEDDEILPEEQCPPPSAFSRRKALVLSTIRTDTQRQQLSLDDFARRSSTVVYPEMQICPGDLMVYSKALINSQLVKEKGKKCKGKVDVTRRGTWSILHLFDRRRKSASITDLELFFEDYKSQVFDDPSLLPYQRMAWNDFYAIIDKQRRRRGFKVKKINIPQNLYDSFEENSASSSSKSSSSSSSSSPKGAKAIINPNTISFIDDDEIVEASASVINVPDIREEKMQQNFKGNSNSDDEIMTIEENDEFGKKVEKLILEEGESSKAETSRQQRATPRLTRQLSDLFKRKETLEKVWVDKGKAEKQESAMSRFQKRLTRTQSERVLGFCRLASWKKKEQPIIEGPSKTENPPPPPVPTVSPREYKRRQAVWEIFQTECIFLFDHLTVLKLVFMEPLKDSQVEGFLMFAEPQLLFGNLDDLYRVTRNFCRSFIRLLSKQVGPNGELPTVPVLEALFRKNEDGDIMTQAYHSYALNYINALTYLETLRTYEAFNVFEKWCATDQRCRKLQLTDLLVAPVQHIMKIPLLLKEVLAQTECPQEEAIIRNILEIEENSLRQLDDKMKWLKNYEHLLELQRNITWDSALEMDSKLFVPEFIKPALQKQFCDRLILSPRRKIINEGQLSCWDSGKPQDMIFLLFDDMLLMTRKKKLRKKSKPGLVDTLITPCQCGRVYKQPLSLDRMHLYEPTLAEMASVRMNNLFLLIAVNRFQQVVTIHTLQSRRSAEKENWITLIREAQENYKKNLEGTIFRPASPTAETGENIIKELKAADKADSGSLGDGAEDTGYRGRRRSSSKRGSEALAIPGPSGSQFLAPPRMSKKSRRKISI